MTGPDRPTPSRTTASDDPLDGAVRDRVVAAALACIERSGMQMVSLEEIAREASMGRATIYRHFPGGRNEVISATVTASVEQFWRQLALDVKHVSSLEDRLVVGLMSAHRRIEDHELLQRLLASEPDELLPAIAESAPLVHAALHRYLVRMLENERLRDGVDLDHAGQYLARILLSHIGSSAMWDLADTGQVRELVRTQFLGGILELDPVV